MEFFSSFGGEDPLKPSIFELVAQEQLRDLLQPALKYVLAVRGILPHAQDLFAHRRNSRCSRNDTRGICCVS